MFSNKIVTYKCRPASSKGLKEENIRRDWGLRNGWEIWWDNLRVQIILVRTESRKMLKTHWWVRMFSEHLVMVEQVLHYMHGYITSKRKKEEWTKKIKIISANTLFFFQKKKKRKGLWMWRFVDCGFPTWRNQFPDMQCNLEDLSMWKSVGCNVHWNFTK